MNALDHEWFPPSLDEYVDLPLPDVKIAIEQDPSLVLQADEHGRTMLSHAAECGRNDIAAMLVRAGAPVNTVDDVGRTPLHWAANAGDLGTIELLLTSGALTEVADHGGRTPLRWAKISRSGRSNEAVAILLRFGAKPRSADKGNT